MASRLALAVLASGEGTTLEAIAEAIAGGHLNARIVVVVSDRPHVGAIERARRWGLATAVLPFRGKDPSVWAAELSTLLHEFSAELVVLAGFLAILPPVWVNEWRGRVINLHPSLLPRHGGRGMYGRHVHEAVLASHDPETGVTVHLVTNEVDGGPLLLQHRVPVLATDTPETLRKRLRPLEHELLLDALRQFADGRWSLPYSSSDEGPRSREDRRPTG
ncbi:MAG: phosphoribosylglycinamide formyltransferase [Thermoplasmata archaeon]